MSLKGKAVIAQGGGGTAVINQSLVGAVLEAKKSSDITAVYGAIGGVEGIVNQDFIDLSLETDQNLEDVAKTPSQALYTTRVKPDREYCQRILEVFKLHDVRYFFYIGGNDSSDTVRIINEHAQEEGYDFVAIHIPKTIDNDLVINDHTPGFGSAARYVSSVFMGLNLDNIALKGVHIAMVMGRNAGFLTASAALARKFPNDGPHLIYLPERTLNIDSFLKDVKEVYDREKRCIIAMSEGVKNEKGEPLLTDLVDDIEVDAHGNVQLSGSGLLGDTIAELIRKKAGIKKVRVDTLGYPQRNYVGATSDTDALEAREVGQKAVHFALNGQKSGSVVINRIADYDVDYSLVPLEEIGGKTKLMPDYFINEAGNDITEEFIKYARPLVGKDFPSPARLLAPRIAKK